MKKLLFLIVMMVVPFAFSVAQAGDPCRGDTIGKRAGSGNYKVPADCDVIIMSHDSYRSIRIGERKTKEEINLLDQEIVLLKEGNALRDSVVMRKDSIIKAQEVAIKEYRDIASDAIKAGEDCSKNTDRCLDELKKERIRTKIFTILGAAGGLIVGFVTGIFIAS